MQVCDMDKGSEEERRGGGYRQVTFVKQGGKMVIDLSNLLLYSLEDQLVSKLVWLVTVVSLHTKYSHKYKTPPTTPFRFVYSLVCVYISTRASYHTSTYHTAPISYQDNQRISEITPPIIKHDDDDNDDDDEII